MSNNTTSCMTPEMKLAEGHLNYAAYAVVTPVYLVMGLVCRVSCAVAFYKQYKKEKGYAYQISASISDILEVITVTLCMFLQDNLSGYRLPGVAWFKRNYVLMWYSAHCASPCFQAFVTSSLLMAVSMAADRVFALSKPFTYRNIHHKRHQMVAVVCSFALGLSTSAFDLFRYDLTKKGDEYAIIVNEAYVATEVALALALVRNAVRIISNVVLVVCDVAIVILYRSTRNKTGPSDRNIEREEKKRATEKALVLLTISQSIFMSVDISLYNVYYTLAFCIPTFTNCFGRVMAPFCALILQLTGIMEFFAMFAISEPFRRVILTYGRCKTSTPTTGVSTLTR